MRTGQGDDEVRAHWLAVALHALFGGVDTSDLEPFTARIGSDDVGVALRVDAAGAAVVERDDEEPDLRIEGDPTTVMALLAGDRRPKDVPGAVVGPASKRRAFETLATRAAASS
jgi:hypothetical protein